MQEEKIIDVKGTFKQFIEADLPEMSQEEAIMRYEEKSPKSNSNNNDDSDTTEEQEHLKRIKQELLASLKRVEKMEEQLFKDRDSEKIKLRVKDSQGGGHAAGKALEEKYIAQSRAREAFEHAKEENQKER